MSEPQQLEVTAPDGRRLAATRFPGSTGDVVVVAPAAGVPQRVYAGFARSVSERGPSVFTFDFRGVGASRAGHPRRDPATMRDWGTLDIEAMLRHAGEEATGRVRWVGQSAGASCMPLAASCGVVDRILSVSVMSGYWRLLAERERLRLAVGWYLVFPAVTAVAGYAPGWLWGGTDLPRGVMRDWGRWCRDPDYLFGDPRVDASGYADITAPVLAVRAADDPWATEEAEAAITDRLVRAPITHRVVTPAEVGAERIGHIDLLRRSVGEPVWGELIDWLLS